MTPSDASLEALRTFVTSSSPDDARARFRNLEAAVQAACRASRTHLRVVINRIKVQIAELPASPGVQDVAGYIREQLLTLLYRVSRCLSAAERTERDEAQRVMVVAHYPLLAGLTRTGEADLAHLTPLSGATRGGAGDVASVLLTAGLIAETGSGKVELTLEALRLLGEIDRQRPAAFTHWEDPRGACPGPADGGSVG